MCLIGDYEISQMPFYSAKSMFGLKFNLFNYKLSNPDDIVAKILQLDELQNQNSVNISAANKQIIESIRSEIKNYEYKKWLRPSIAVEFPFYDFATTRFTAKTIFVSIGYDIGDIACVKIGYSPSHTILVGFSIDVSTPVYAASQNFFRLATNAYKVPGFTSANYSE